MSITERGPRRRLGRLALVGGILLVLILGGYLVATLLLRSLLDPVGLADRLEPRISAALNRPVSIEVAHVRVFPRPSVRLAGLRIENLGPFADLPLATAEEIRLDPRLLPLLRRRVEINRVLVRRPRALLQVDREGRTNFGDFVPEREEPAEAEAAGLVLEVRRLELREGRIGYRDAQAGRRVQVDGIRLEAAVARTDDGEARFSGSAAVDSVRLGWPPVLSREVRGLPLQLTAIVRMGPNFGWAEIDSATLRVRSVGVSVRGHVDSLRASERRIDIEIAAESLPLAALIGSLPDSARSQIRYRLEGETDAHLRVSGSLGPGVRPQVEGLVTVRDAGARDRDGRMVLEEGSAEVAVRDGRAVIERVNGRLLEGPFEARGAVDLDSKGAWEMTVGMRPSLEAASTLIPPPPEPAPGWKPLAARGSASVDVRLNGRLAEAAATRAEGAVVLRGAELRGGRLEVPVRLADGKIELRGDRAMWRDLVLEVGADDVITSGTIVDLFARPGPDRGLRWSAEARTRRLDLDALRGGRRNEIGYGRIAFARLGGRELQGRSPEQWARERSLRRPDRLPLSGEVFFVADTLLSSPHRLTDVRGRAVISPDRLVVEDLAFAAYGGSGSGRLVAELGEAESQPFRLDLDLQGVRAERFLAETTPLGAWVQGGLSLDLALEGELDRLLLPVRTDLQGIGRLEIREGRLGSGPVSQALASFLRVPGLDTLQFARWTSPFEVRDGAVRLSDGRISAPDLVLALSGAVGFDGGLDLALVLRPDSTRAREMTQFAGPANELVEALLRTGAPLEVGILVGGTTRDPRFTLDPSALESATRRAAEAAVEDAGRRGRRELERQGQDLLRRLTGGQATDSAPRTPDAGSRDTTPAPAGPAADTAMTEGSR